MGFSVDRLALGASYFLQVFHFPLAVTVQTVKGILLSCMCSTTSSFRVTNFVR